METLAIISLVGNVVQFVDFSGKLIAKSTELYRSSEGALAENIDAETATNHLVLLNNKIKDAATIASDDTLKRLCESCKFTADELLAALNKVKINGQQDRWKSIRKALRSVWSKEQIRELEGRLARFREELNLHIIVDLREQALRIELDHSGRFKDLDLATQGVLDAIVKQQDVFKAVHDTQIDLMGTLHSDTVSRVENEHATTRREIIGETVFNIQAEHAITRKMIQEIRQREQEPCLAVPRKPSWSVPLPRNHHFVGRDSKLHELESSIFGEKHCSKVAVIGLGGVGKTQVALELAYRTRDKRPECSIFWVSATNTENVQQAYLEIAQQLHIPGLEDKKEDVRKLVQHYLSQESAGQWLLVLDNADDLDMWLKKTDSNTTSTCLIDSLPRSDKGSIVFTTRSRKAASKFAHSNVIHVAEMDEEAAALVLRNALVNKEVLNDSPTVVQLLKLLTFLPLAIVQAAAYINENDISLTEYVLLFDDREENIIEVLSEDFEDEGRYRDLKNPIATTWLISFEQIRLRDPLAADYLSFMSCIDPKTVPLSLLPPARTKKQGMDAIGTLSAYSFITKRPADQCFDLHRLVHLATRNWLRGQELLLEWTAKAIARLAEVFPDDNYKNRAVWRSYLPHAYYVQASNVFQDRLEENIFWIRRFGKCLLSDGRLKEAEVAFMQVIETTSRVLGSEHRDTLTGMSDRAVVLRRQGKYEAAEEMSQQVLEGREKVLGKEDPDTFKSMNTLALVLQCQRKYEVAEEIHRRALKGRERELGKEHVDTLASVNNLAAVLLDQGKSEEAENLSRRALEGREKILAKDDPEILISESNLLGALWYQEKDKELEQRAWSVLQRREKILGREHYDTLSSMMNLALVLRRQKKFEAAKEINQQAFEGFEKTLGKEHPDTLKSKSSLAMVLQAQREV